MRTKGTLLIGLGLTLILGAAGLTGYNLWENQQAGAAAAQDLAQLLQQEPLPAKTTPIQPEQGMPVPETEADYLLVPEMEMPVTEVDGREYVGTLEMLTIGRTLPVLNSWDAELLQIAPCRYTGSAYSGNLILMAHNYDSHFGRLKNLQTGDLVTFRDVEGNVFTYEVAELEILNPTDTQRLEEGDWDLTLFTCTVGGKTRVTVRCVRTESHL